ncbi:MAG: ABC transporter permease [Acidobacteria bacterium]|nr:ABC transporter permease [Acidobacteriota bacterium]
MPGDYLKNAFRHLYRVRIFTCIQILGLAAGLATSMLIFHYVIFETGFDTFYPHYERIYRLRCERISQEETTARFASCCPAAPPLIRARYPEVEAIARIHRCQANFSYEDRVFTEYRMFFAEPDFLRIFPLPLRQGNLPDGLRDPNTAFISAATARKYFGDSDPMDRVIQVDKHTAYKITGVFEDIPANSHLHFDILLSYPNLRALYDVNMEESWGHTGFYTYLRLRENADACAFRNRLPQLVQSEFGEELGKYQMELELQLQPLKDIHLHSRFMQEYEPGGNAMSVQILTGIAFFILFFAWINDINLASAIALRRGKEIGLRKAVGAGRLQIMGQSLLETGIVHFLAVLLGLTLLSMGIPFFDRLIHAPLGRQLWLQGWFWASLAIFFVGGVIAAGMYPALILTRHQPVEALYRYSAPSTAGPGMRQLLVLVQFVISLFLITITFTLYQQLSFMKNQETGFRTDGIVVIQAPRVRPTEYGTTFTTFKELLHQQPGITGIAHVTEVPGRRLLWDAGGIYPQGAVITHSRNYKIVGIDEDFVGLFRLELLAGRNFKGEYEIDRQSLLLNESAVEWLGFADALSALGEKVDYWGDVYTVVGVLKN